MAAHFLSWSLSAVPPRYVKHPRAGPVDAIHMPVALTGVYLKSTKNRPDDHCWWCDPENDSGTHQTRDHLFKHCYKWKDQQAAMWARVKDETKNGKQKWRVGDLLGDGRCSPAVLDFLRSTHVGRTTPPVEEN